MRPWPPQRHSSTCSGRKPRVASGWSRSRERANELTFRAVELLVEAYRSNEEAEGVARAVGIARRGETWAPINRHGDIEELFGLKRSA